MATISPSRASVTTQQSAANTSKDTLVGWFATGISMLFKAIGYTIKWAITVIWYIVVIVAKLTFWFSIGFLIGAFWPRKIK